MRWIAFYFFFLPFWWALSPAENIDLSLGRLIVPLLFFVWLISSLVNKKLIFSHPLLQMLWLSWLFWCLASATWAWESGWALRKALFFGNFLLLIPLLLGLTAEQLKTCLKAFTMGAAAAALVGIGQFLLAFGFSVERVFSWWVKGILPLFLGHSFAEVVAAYPSLLVNIGGQTYLRATAFFPDPHLFALYLGMALPFAFVWALEKRQAVAFLLPGSILLSNLLTFSRGAYLALGGALAATFFLLWRQGLIKRVGRALMVSLLLLGVAGFSPVGTRFFSSFSLEDGSNQERWRLLVLAVQDIPEVFWAGRGLGNYAVSLNAESTQRNPFYVHNLYLDIWLELGLIGLSIFLSLFGVAFFRGYRNFSQSGDAWKLAGMIALIIFFTHAFFETPLFSIHVLPVLLLVWANLVKPVSLR